jgi:hypothetical protein
LLERERFLQQAPQSVLADRVRSACVEKADSAKRSRP